MKTCLFGIQLLILISFASVNAQEPEPSKASFGIDQTNEIMVPFFSVDQVPVFPACQNEATLSRRDCFSRELQKHISTHFTYPEDAIENNIEGSVIVLFVVNTAGNITSIKTHGNPILSQEAQRIVALLPKMKPGMHNNRVVKVPFSLPINFNF